MIVKKANRLISAALGSTALALVLTLSAATTTLLAPVAARADDSQARTEAATTEDVVVLTDGRRIAGKIVGEDDQFVSIRAGGVLRAYPKDRVESVTRAAPAPDPAPTASDESAQPVESPADPAVTKKAEKKRARKAARDAAPARLSAEAQAWLTELLNRMRSPAARDPAVRTSLASALRAMGPAAVAPIRAAAADADAEVAEVLKRTAVAIERGTAARGATSDRARTGDDMRGAKTDAARPADILSPLALTREQASQIKELVREHLMSRRDIYKQARTDGTGREQIAAQLNALRTKSSESIRGLLNPEQAAQFDAVADTFMQAVEAKSRGRGAKKKAKPKKKEADPASQ